MNAAIEPTRLYAILARTGLLKKDPVLYQLLYNLIGNVVNLTSQTTTSSSGGGGGGSTSIINNITQIIESLGSEERITEYVMIGSQSSSVTPTTSTYDSPLTNGDSLIPEIIFDSFGDVVMVTGIPL